jgi:hypothetical protein
MGARLGQWLQDGFGCSTGMHIVVLSKNVSIQRNDARLWRVFFIFRQFDVSIREVDA